MPLALVNARQKLDVAVDAAYGKRAFKNDAERVSFMLALYQQYANLLPMESGKAKRRTAKKP